MRPMVRRGAIALAAAGSAAALALTGVPGAGAATAACGNTPRCFGILSHQSSPLEIATSVPVAQVHGGTTLIGMTPSGTRRQDFHVGRYGSTVIFRWAPGGVSSHLVIAATGDVSGSRPRLELFQPGTAGSSHEFWVPLNVTDHGFRVYKNAANGLVLAISRDGTVVLRPVGLGTGGNKNFILSQPF